MPPTPAAQRSRLGGCGGDPAGFPNGRRTTDDVTDCFLRAGFGILIPEFNVFPFNRLGDGVNVNDNPVSGHVPVHGAREQRPQQPPRRSGGGRLRYGGDLSRLLTNRRGRSTSGRPRGPAAASVERGGRVEGPGRLSRPNARRILDAIHRRACCAAACALAGGVGRGAPAEARICARRRRASTRRAGRPRARGRLVALAAAHTPARARPPTPTHYERALEALAARGELDPQQRGRGQGRGVGAARPSRVRARPRQSRARMLARQPDDHESLGLLGDALMELGRTERGGGRLPAHDRPAPGTGRLPARVVLARARGRPRRARARCSSARSRRPARARPSSARGRSCRSPRSSSASARSAARAEARRQALALFPGYHYALAALTQHQLAQRAPRGRRSPLAPARADGGAAPRALARRSPTRCAGWRARRRRAPRRTRFEREALANVERADNENQFLVDFFLDRRPDPARALEIAEREAASGATRRR